MDMGFSVGMAVRDITPADPQRLHGYSARHQKSLGVREPLSLRCLAVGNGNETVLVIALDMIGVPLHACDRWYGLLEREVGIGFPQVLIAGTHTHFAPGVHATIYSSPEAGLVEPDGNYVALVESQLVGAAREALSRCRPAGLETVRVPVPGVLFNRRTVKSDGMVQVNYLYPLDETPFEFSPVDDELTVLRFRTEQGFAGALVNFGCHPVTGTDLVPDGMRQISADYPYYLREELEKTWACPVLFLLGAAGDTVPIDRQGDCRQRIGRVLADTAALAERRYRPDAMARVSAACRSLPVETIIETDPAAAPAAFEEARAACCADGSSEHRARYDACSRALYRSQLYPENQASIPVQQIQIGSQTLVALPFEVLSGISLRMKERLPANMLVSCAGGYQGYLPLAADFAHGGYGATPETVHFAADTGDRLLAEILTFPG